MGRIIFQALLYGLLLCAALPITVAAKSNTVKLPGGMSITLPVNWKVQPEEKGAPALIALGRDEKNESFGMVMVNQTSIPDQEEPLTQDKLPSLSAEEKTAFLEEMKENFRAEFSGANSPF